MKQNPVVHFEMPYEDPQRAISFYSAVFGWQMNKMGSDLGDYIIAVTTETDEKRMIKTPGNINGGLFPKKAGGPQVPSVVISVEDIRDSIKQVNSNGGKVLAEPSEIPGVGLYVSFTDTEGNVVSMLQPFQM